MKVPVLLPNIFDYPFTYESNFKLKTGDYVTVPFGKGKRIGVVWNEFEKGNKKKFLTKKIFQKLDVHPLKKETINFLNAFSYYNLIPKGMALKLHLLSNEAINWEKDKDYETFNRLEKINQYQLNEEQKNSYEEITKNDKKFRVHLLQGTTGSGKTIVYFNSLKKKLDEGFQGLILLPEIGLTNEFEKKFIDFFGFRPCIWHSGISKKKKKIIWSGISKGKLKVVIGARSALFLPFSKLGLIIVDEEHDQSYKQDEGVIYNARDMAISRGYFENIPVNLITSVPSLETYENVKKKKYFLSRLVNRFQDAKLPKYEVIDLKKYKLQKKSWISPKTIERVDAHLKKGDQVLFFLNRRGFSPYIFCTSCLKSFSCPNCSINLVYHKEKKILLCHYCNYKTQLERICKDNQVCKFSFTGPGVERIYEEINDLFPTYKSLIFSSDTINKKSSSDKLEKIINNKINILVGTQLISKGFHFPSLNCIVVVDIDSTYRGHDLRAAEKNLQLYHQLSGRAGRAGSNSTVYYQTYNLDPKIISKITQEDPFIFLENELLIRKKNNLPPYERFISLIVTSKNEKKIILETNRLKNHLEKRINAKILGPINAPIFKIKKNFRCRLLLRSKKGVKIQHSLALNLKSFKLSQGIKLSVDVDPINFN